MTTKPSINELKLASRLQAAVVDLTKAAAKLRSIKTDAQRYYSDLAVTIDLVYLSEQVDAGMEDAAHVLGSLEIIAAHQH